MQFRDIAKNMGKLKPGVRTFDSVYKTTVNEVIYSDGFGLLIMHDVTIPADRQNQLLTSEGMLSCVRYPNYGAVIPKDTTDSCIDVRLVEEAIKSVKDTTKLVANANGINIDVAGLSLGTLIRMIKILGVKNPKIDSIRVSHDSEMYHVKIGSNDIYVGARRVGVEGKSA